LDSKKGRDMIKFNFIKKVGGVLSIVLPSFVLEGFAFSSDIAMACPPAVIAAIMIGGAVLGGVSQNQANKKAAEAVPDPEDLLPKGLEYLINSGAPGADVWREATQNDLEFLKQAAGMELFDQVEAQGAGNIRKKFSEIEDANARAAFFGVGPQALSSSTLMHSEASAINEFKAMLQKLSAGFAMDASSQINARAGLAAGALGNAAAMQFQADLAQKPVAAGVLQGAATGASLAGSLQGMGAFNSATADPTGSMWDSGLDPNATSTWGR
jgi:hypothetical protein